MGSFLGLLDKKRIASKLNLNVVKSNKFGGEERVLPKSIKSVDNLRAFSSEWESALRKNPNISHQHVKLEAYNRMDNYGAIPAAVLNVFADESLNVTKSHLPAVDFSINDPAVEAKVRKCLEINNLIQNSRIREDKISSPLM